MSLWKNYLLAHSIPEALEALFASPRDARLVAGGTDLLLELQQDLQPPIATLIDVTSIPELQVIEIRDDYLFIGAGVSVTRIVNSPLVQHHALALVEACVLIGGPQVRNAATLGGNVAHALPAADGTIALLAFDARAEAASLAGARCVEVLDLFLGPRRSDLEARRELLVGFRLPLRQGGEGTAFRRVMRPQGVALPILNMAIWLRRTGESIEDIRLAIGPAGPKPVRGLLAEATLRGQVLEDELVDRAYQSLASEIRLRTSEHRATHEYRRHLSRVLLEDCLQAAWERAEKE
jgi:carbon-monoxide dehydrogenase medium subunit